MIKTLLFIYNANSNPWSKIFDALHKVVHPVTYDCNLCKLTHGVLKEKEQWSDFRKQSSSRMMFMYRDQFLKLHGVANEKFSFPLILHYKNEKYQPLITAKELQCFKGTKELIDVLQQRLQKQPPSNAVKAAS